MFSATIERTIHTVLPADIIGWKNKCVSTTAKAVVDIVRSFLSLWAFVGKPTHALVFPPKEE
jgi:hypothetical protein